MARLIRRKFLTHSGLLLGGLLSPFSLTKGRISARDTEATDLSMIETEGENTGKLDIASIPNFCSHEHWGSIASIGFVPEQEGFRCDTTAGALPSRATSIWDLVLDPYEGGWMSAANRDPDAQAVKAGFSSQKQWWDAAPQSALEAFRALTGSMLMTGGFQCTRRGLMKLYGTDISLFHTEEWKTLDTSIQKNYSDIFSWYRLAMNKANFSELIRPVHPEFYVQESTPQSKLQELSFTHTILRIDPLLDLWKEGPRRDSLSRIAGIEPGDAKSWREFIRKIFDLAAQNHTTGIKQLQAYSRSLDFQPRTDLEVTFKGQLIRKEIICFQDWVMHECCKQAHERNWVHQVHVGTNNIVNSSPMPLEELALRYPQMNIVMIHCWPFLKEAGWLAKFVPNMHIDSCWLPVLNPAFLREALALWLNYVPVHKIMLAHDSTHVEMAAGSSLFTREILAENLLQQHKTLQISTGELRAYAADMLQNNAVRLYRIGKEFKV